jgi:hypothetical protein
MAKAAKKAAKGSPAAKAEAAASYKYGVEDVAKATGRKATSVRVAFRNHGVEKAEGGVYGWNKEADMKAAIEKAFPAKKSAKKAVAKKKAKKSED